MTRINVYNLNFLDYFANDINLNMGIGEQILQLKKEHASSDWDKVDLFLCNELYRPLVIKLDKKLYDFGNWNNNAGVLENVPVDAHWSQLIYKETIDLTLNDVHEYAKEHSITDRLDDGDIQRKIVERILERELREKSEKGSFGIVGIFNNDKGELVAYAPFGREKAFVSKVSYDYQSLMNQFMQSQKSH